MKVIICQVLNRKKDIILVLLKIPLLSTEMLNWFEHDWYQHW